MSRAFGGISGIFRLGPHDVAPTVSVFPTIDERSIATKLDIDRRGRADGAANVPPAEARDLSATEQEIVSAVSTIRQHGLSDYAQELKLYEDRMHAIDLDGRIAQISNTTRDGIANLKKTGHTGRIHLYQFRDDVRELEEAVRDFRAENKLRRPPKTPRNKALSIGILAVLFVIEGGLNGVFLATNNVLGLIGGIGTAIGIAFVNIILSVLLGRVSIYVNHARVVKKLFGGLAVIAFIAFCGTLNLLVSHFRDAASTMAWNDATVAAMRTFLAAPFDLQSVESAILFAMGATFGVIAYVDGLTWSDPYPGYAAIVTQRDNAREDYAAEVEERVEDLVDAKDSTLAAIEDARSSLSATARNYLQAFNGRLGLRTGLPLFLSDVDQKVNSLLARYREANRASRKAAAPPHFAEAYAFPVPTLHGDVRSDDDQLQAVSQLMERADAMLEERTVELLTSFETEMREYESLKQVAGG